ncbi:phage tail tape measure protein [Larkinella knui]|uniref:Phage tail tape measure protein n=2 Tax=Larkinella knui TaxID=2025310 RepID=A0A3P1CGK5_9BACT|nr:phage tail tape measure protein [Larkinella knui]
MGMDLNETASITLKIEGDAARNQLALLEGEARKLERALKEAPKGSQEWAELYKELGKNQDAQKGLRESVGLTGLTMKQLENESRSLTKELKNLTPGTEEFVAKSARLSEVNTRLGEVRIQARGVGQALGETSTAVADWDDKNKRATLSVKQLREVADQLGKEIESLVPGTKAHADAVAKQNEVQKQLGTTLAEQPSRWKQVQNAVVGFIGAFSFVQLAQEVYQFFREGVDGALKLSDMMGGVAKATGLSTEQVTALSDALSQIDTRTTKEDLMSIAQIGGQLGVANDELLGFVKSVDKAVVALGDEFTGGAEEAAKEIGALQKLFKETRDMKAGDAINDIGSALNELGAAGSATAPVVADFAQRMGQLGDLSPQITQTMGLGAAFQELGMTAEIAAGGLSSILMGASRDTATFAKQLGITETQMKQLINTNPNEFLLKLADSLRGLPTDQVNKRLAELGIKSDEATKVMSLLKDQTDMVRQKQELAANAMKGVYNVALETVTKSTDKFAKQLGMSEAELTKLIKSNPNEFFIKLATSFKGLSESQIAAKMKELGFNSGEAAKLVSDLSKATSRQAQEQLLANPALKQATSLQDEFNKMNQTAAAEMDKAKKAMKELAVDAGGALLPFLQKGIQGFVAFVNIIRAVPEFLSENKTELALLGGALLAFNGHLIASTASSLAHAAAEKARLIWTQSATTAQQLLNLAMEANPVGVVIAAVMLLVSGFVALYNNSLTVRAGINGLFEAMKVAAGELVNFWNAITSLNFAEAATIMWEGGKKIAAGFNKGYEEQIKAEQPKHLANHKTLIEQKKTASVQGAKETGQLETLEDQNTHDQKAKQAKAAREKENAEIQKDTQAIIAKKREAQIAAIADETQREIAKLQWKYEQEVAAIQSSKAREADKTAAIKALDAQLKVDIEAENKKHLEKITADQQKALAMERELKLALETDEKARRLADAQFKYETEKARIEKEITDEVQEAQLLTLLKAKYTQDVAAINTEFRNRERESNNFIRTQEQAAEMAQFDWKELNAGNNAQKLIQIKRDRLQVELNHLKANLAAERDAELARIQESNLSQEQKAAQQTAINAKYTADVALAGKQLESEMARLDEEHVARKRERWQNYSNAFKSILDGDVAGFTAAATQMFQVDEEHRNKKLQRTSEVADQVGDIAKQGVAFLNKLTQERLDKEIAASKKETETKLADSKTRMEAAIKAAEEQAEAEKLAAGDSAEEIERIETKLAESKTSIREDFESEADSIRKDGADKEKALAKQKWEADKKAQVATALISGAQAALKALASGIFPVNLVFAGIIAGLTALQIAKIKNQPAPSFARGVHGYVEDGQVKPMYGEGGIDRATDRWGWQQQFRKGGKSYVKNAGVLQGGRHGGRYGERGISMIDRESGREVGEAEGGEPFMILSRNTYSNNKPVIDRLLYSSMYRNGQKIAYRDGGVGGGNWGLGSIGETPYFERRMMLFGTKKAKREAEAAARDAEVAAQQAEANAAMSSMYDGPTSGDEGDANGTADAGSYSGDASAAAAAAAKKADKQLELLEDIGDAITSMSEDLQLAMKTMATSIDQSLDSMSRSNTLALGALSVSMRTSINSMAGDVRELKGSINAVEGATREVKGAVDGVQGAVWGTNQAGRLDALISAISSLG